MDANEFFDNDALATALVVLQIDENTTPEAMSQLRAALMRVFREIYSQNLIN